MAEQTPAVETKEVPVATTTDTAVKETAPSTADDTSIMSDAAKETTPIPETAEQKTARLAEEDKLLKADEKTLTAEQKTQREKLVEQRNSVVPEKYELKLPEGLKLDDKAIEELSPVLKELKVTQGQLQGLVEKVYAPMLKKAVDASHQESMSMYKEMVDGWKTDAQKLIGADKTKLANIGKFVSLGGNKDEFQKMLNETGVGNHPVFVKFALSIMEKFSQDKFTEGIKTGKPDTGVDLNKMYPSMTKT